MKYIRLSNRVTCIVDDSNIYHVFRYVDPIRKKISKKYAKSIINKKKHFEISEGTFNCWTSYLARVILWYDI